MNSSLNRLFRNVFLFLALSLTVESLYSQVPRNSSASPHSLLWRISGKGLAKPSYLYGTMHLTDKRLFRFDDSVYRAIENTQGLAIEVNPDEMAAYFVNKLFDQIENGKKLQDVVDRQYFDKNRKALSKKFNKPAEEVSASDVIKEKNKWMSEYMEKGEMPTFMDAYLYNIARRQGKWLGGIEDLTDQTGLISDLVDESDINYLLASDSATKGSIAHSYLEKMIGAYSDQDLDAIEDMTELHSSAEEKDKMLIRRNVKMARRIDSLASVRTMFLAIGAAHLPGDSGVIDLLRRRGFTVDPVFSRKKIEAKDYTFQEIHLPWVPVSDAAEHYKAEMPGNPATIKLYGVVEMKFLLDLFNLTGFCTMASMNSSHLANNDSLFRLAASRMFKGAVVKPVRDLQQNGVTGKEYIHSSAQGNLRVQIFVDDKMIYMAILSAFKKENLQSADADKFFHSFAINRAKEQTASVSGDFVDSIMGISFRTPAPITYNEKISKQNADATWKVSCFMGADVSTGDYIMLFSKEVKPGYHIPDENVIHENFYELMKKQYNVLHVDSSILDNLKVVKVTGRNIQQTNLYTCAMSVVKDGRQLLLMTLGDSASIYSPAMQGVIGSFHFIPHSSVNWRKYESPDHTFSAYLPASIQEHFYKGGKKMQWVSYDTTTATSYMVLPDTLGKYSWYSSDSLFWKINIGSDTTVDRLLEIKDVVNGDLPGREFIVRNKKNGDAYSRTRLLLSGDKIYKLFVAANKSLLTSPEVNRFFDEFRLDGNSTRSTITESKASLLIQDLGSADSATRHDANMALFYAKFVKADATLLREAVFKSYRSPYDTSWETTINDRLARELAKLNDPATIDYIRQSYPSLINEKRKLRNSVLSILALQHAADSYAVLAELLRQGPTSKRLGYEFTNAVKDSMSLAAGLFPAFQTWIADTLQAPTVASIALSLLDSGYLSKDSLSLYAPAFLKSAAALLPALKVNDDYEDYNMFFLLQLMRHFNTPSSRALLKSYLAVKNKYLLREVVLQLVKGGQTDIPVTVLNRLAADPVTRTSLYDGLKEEKKTALFPKAYMTQASLAESAVYDAIDEEDDDETLEKLVFLSKRTAAYHGKVYTWYLYKASFTGDDEPYQRLAIAGGYDAAGVRLKPVKDLTGFYREEQFDPRNIGGQFAAYLKGLESDE
ncbi:MAG TPA: TraB/GumN family protein [Puia sp.]|jgi:uncharacterized protein YbaP (TraB family)